MNNTKWFTGESRLLKNLWIITSSVDFQYYYPWIWIQWYLHGINLRMNKWMRKNVRGTNETLLLLAECCWHIPWLINMRFAIKLLYPGIIVNQGKTFWLGKFLTMKAPILPTYLLNFNVFTSKSKTNISKFYCRTLSFHWDQSEIIKL